MTNRGEHSIMTTARRGCAYRDVAQFGGRVSERRLRRKERGKSGCRGRNSASDSERTEFRAPQTEAASQRGERIVPLGKL